MPWGGYHLQSGTLKGSATHCAATSFSFTLVLIIIVILIHRLLKGNLLFILSWTCSLYPLVGFLVFCVGVTPPHPGILLFWLEVSWNSCLFSSPNSSVSFSSQACLSL